MIFILHGAEMMCRNRSADVHSQHAWAANVDATRTNQNIPGLQASTNRIPEIQHIACITAVPVLETCLEPCCSSHYTTVWLISTCACQYAAREVYFFGEVSEQRLACSNALDTQTQHQH